MTIFLGAFERVTKPAMRMLSPEPTLPRVEMFASCTGPFGGMNSEVLPFASVAVAVSLSASTLPGTVMAKVAAPVASVVTVPVASTAWVVVDLFSKSCTINSIDALLFRLPLIVLFPFDSVTSVMTGKFC